MTIQDYVNNFCKGNLFVYFSNQSIKSGEYKANADENYLIITSALTKENTKFCMKNLKYERFPSTNLNNHSIIAQVLTTRLSFILIKNFWANCTKKETNDINLIISFLSIINFESDEKNFLIK